MLDQYFWQSKLGPTNVGSFADEFSVYTKKSTLKPTFQPTFVGMKIYNYFCTKLLAANDPTFVPTFVGNCFCQQMLGQHYEHVHISNPTNVGLKVGKNCPTNVGSCCERLNNIANIYLLGKMLAKTRSQQMLAQKMLASSANDPTFKPTFVARNVG